MSVNMEKILAMRSYQRDGRRWAREGAMAAAVAGTSVSVAAARACTASEDIALPEAGGNVRIAVPPIDLPIAIAPAEEIVATASLLDDVMLVLLVVTLVACAAFVWTTLPRFLATG